jgi:transcription initiation factor TFIIIB Brf1 subunit/transcription initiation factor TFIIB
MNSNIDIWKEFDNAVNFDKITYQSDKESHKGKDICHNCLGNNLKYIENECICQDCGLVLNEDRLNNSPVFENNIESTNKSYFNKNNKISKMQEWYMWSNEEKNTYKLKSYVRDFCSKLKIVECLIENIVETTVIVIDCIKKNDGTKRARVKDGIIICCIHYVSKDTQTPYSYVNISKQLNLDIKYITRAERLILELINSKKLNLDKQLILDTQKPFEYVKNTIKKNNLKVSEDVLKDVNTLIEICEDNDILLDHTPLSIGVCCFYYILQLRNIDIDIKIFSELYDLSSVTIIKTYNKLKIYKRQIEQIL